MLIDLITIASLIVSYKVAPYNDSFDFASVSSCENEMCSTFKLSDNNYISFFTPFVTERVRDNQGGTTVNTKYFLRDKYVIDGTTSSNDNSSYLVVGETPLLGGLNPMSMTSFVEIDLSLFPPLGLISSAGVLYTKQSGNLSQIEYGLVENCTFDLLNGSTSFSSSYIGTSVIPPKSNVFDIDLTDDVLDYLEEENDTMIIYLTNAEQNKSCQLYSAESSFSYPLLYVVHSDYFGNAPTFYDDFSIHPENCLGYVKNVGKPSGHIYECIDIKDDLIDAFGNSVITYEILSTIGLGVIETCFENNSIRLLESYNSLISPNERRIAFRVELDSTGRFYNNAYHFMCQCIDGSWSGRRGFGGNLENYAQVNAPDFTSNWYFGLLESPTLYFAYSQGYDLL